MTENRHGQPERESTATARDGGSGGVFERCGIDTRHTHRDNTVRAPTGHAPRRNAVAFLASEQTAYITGTVMNVSGVLYTKPPWDRGSPARACTQQDADHQTRTRCPRSRVPCRNAARC